MEPGTVGSIPGIVRGSARIDSAAIALAAPGRATMSYGDLADHVRRTAGAIRAAGVGPEDRVALVLENGPEAASAFLGIASASVCAPLNPAYRAGEFEFFLGDLHAVGLVVGANVETPARDVARKLDIRVLELHVDPSSPAGSFRLDGGPASVEAAEPEPAAHALALHTSGTTGRPKVVPLAHRHLVASARNVAATLRLGPDDRCLNVMPLFHIHGLVAALLASLAEGGSAACTPGFHQHRFFEWMSELTPTWTTAVPTMHQSLLERARREPALVERHPFRFVRSSSAALPPAILTDLEELLRVPVVEAYGMTEAAHQMASNPLPPATRKPGSVGLPAGPEIAILDSDGRQVAYGGVGEVAIRGENVFDGYEANADANDAAFTDGWFRTGDEGRLDEDGYLVLHGRLKEIINRAGEKVSPLEIDEVLLRHPAVAEAVTFAMPNERLGEEVAAAVVLRSELAVPPRDLQDFVAQTVAPFKVPRTIILVDEIPKGPTGKLQRVGLAERLVPLLAATEARGRHTLEDSIAHAWSDVLQLPCLDAEEDFFALGGDSILAAEAVARVRELVGRPDIPLLAIVRAPTPRAMAHEIEGEFGWAGAGVHRLQAGGAEHPLFLAHGVDGECVLFAGLARILGADRPVYAFRAPGDLPGERPVETVEELAELYLEGMRSVQPSGPYLLGAHCMGVTVALELSKRLCALGEASSLLLVDPRVGRPTGVRYTAWLVRRRARNKQLVGAIARRLRRRTPPPADTAPKLEPVPAALERARESYTCAPTNAPSAIIRSSDYARFEIPDWYLSGLLRTIVFEDRADGIHVELYRPPTVRRTAEVMRHALDRLEQA